MFSRNSRKKNGQGLVEGTLGLILVIAGIVGGTLLLMCTGFATSYKQKLGFVAQEVSAYVQGRGDWLGSTRPDYNATAVYAEATEVANQLLQQTGLPPLSKISFNETTVGTNRYCKVTITVDKLRLPGGGLLPSTISLSDTAVSVDHSGDCWGFAWLRVNGTTTGNRGILVPAYGFSGLNDSMGNPRHLTCNIRGACINSGVILHGEINSPILKNNYPGSGAVVIAR